MHLQPSWSLMAYEVRLLGSLEKSGARIRAYVYLIVYQWLLVVCLAGLWIVLGRPWSAILLGQPNFVRFAVGMALAIALVCLTAVQRSILTSRPENFERLRAGFSGATEAVVPHSPEEEKLWPFVAITAGCCEEVLFRGFVYALIAGFTGSIISVVLTSVVFGIYHAYYGWQGILKTGVYGLVMSLIALGSGSLIPAIIIHAATDLMSGWSGARLVRRSA